ncbi:MAG: hypothetical protein IKR19_01370 [Acholeplasmatales bacterium]|nr:hypothetical protein [Acholeplasmatales bacterium]
MKKRYFVLGAFLAMTSLFTLASCDEKENGDNTNITHVVEDNELSLKVFNEYKKSLPNISYDDFLVNGRMYVIFDGEFLYDYSSSTIYLHSDGSFKREEIHDYDENGNHSLAFIANYVDGKWLTEKDIVFETDKFTSRYFTYTEDGSYDRKAEDVYVNNALVSRFQYVYLNNDWLKTAEFTNTDHGFIALYDSSYDSERKVLTKKEYKYNEDNNIVTTTFSDYANNSWVVTKKEEYTYDEESKRTSTTKYDLTNEDWVITEKIEYINEVQFPGYRDYNYQDGKLYSISLYRLYANGNWYRYRKLNVIYVDSDGEYESKIEYSYDFYDNVTETKNYIYENDQWVEDTRK